MHVAHPHRSRVAGIEAVSLTSSHVFPRHSHDQFGIGILTDGAQRSWSGIGPVEAEAGDVITVNPGEIHDGAPMGDRPRSWRMLYFEPSVVLGETRDESVGRAEIARPALQDPALAQVFSRLFRVVTEPGADPLAVEQALVATLVRTLQRHGARPSVAGERSPCVLRALRRLNAAPEIPASLAELAALSGVSRFQLLRAFSREVGTTPYAYLVQRRVRLARQLLKAGQQPAAVAAASGFADQSHLTRAFVRQFGITPARYRAAVA